MSEHLDSHSDIILTAIQAEPGLLGLAPEVQEKLRLLVEILLEGQSRMNLTAIKNVEGIVRYHLADSLAMRPLVEDLRKAMDGQALRVADVGTGAGFPLLPMAIVCNDVQWVGVESIGKKTAFIRSAAEALGLDNVEVLTDRAENVGIGEMRGTFDVMTSRAVGPVASLLEVGMPLLCEGGEVWLFKTESAWGEWKECAEFLKKLGGVAEEPMTYALPGDTQERLIFRARKVAKTPTAYPRQNGLPFNKPMVKPASAGGRQ